MDNRNGIKSGWRGKFTMSNDYKHILQKLPYRKPFLFVDTLEKVADDGVVGQYTFSEDADFYKGHFKDFPVTPGVILTECCAQIGLVCLGIHLLKENTSEALKIGLTSAEMEFLKPIYPGERVRVSSEKVYFRFQKLKCKVKLFDANGTIACKGVISGMFKADEDEK